VSAIASVLFVVIAQVLSPTVADPQAKASAQALLKEGTALYDRGDFAGALGKFEAAYGIYPSPKLQFNIAQADRDLGRPVEALAAFEKFLALATDAAPEVLSEARQSAAELRTKLAQVKIECSISGAEVALDGKTVGSTPLAQPIWVTPGRHQIAIRHQGYGPVVVNVAPGEIQAVAMEPRWRPTPATETLAVSAPTGATSNDSRPRDVAPDRPKGWWSGRKWYVWAAAGGTVLFTTSAIVAGLAATSRFKDLQSSCGGTSAGCSESQIDGVKSRVALTDVLWILAGASAVATGVSFYVESREASVSVAWKF
jgi:hypothetical protein